MEKNIIFGLAGREVSATGIYPLYRAQTGGNILSLRVESYIPSYPLVPWPSLSIDNTGELNDAIIALDEFENAQIHLHFLIRDAQGIWSFLRTHPLLNRGVPSFVDVLKPYRGTLGYLPLQKGYGLGIFWQFPGGRPQGTDFVSIIGDVEESILPEGEPAEDSSFEGVELLFSGERFFASN